MESPNALWHLPGGEQKIEEYVRRIRAGESKEAIFEGLPESFKSGIEMRLASLEAKEITDASKEEKKDIEQRQIEELRKKLGADQVPGLSMEERKKLQGWPASYELAKIAKQQGIDLSKISREEYVDFAIQNSLAIDDGQLRVAPWQRMGTSVEEIVAGNRERKALINPESEKSFARFSHDTQAKAGTEDRFLGENIKVRQGTKDSNSWLFFGINKGIAQNTNETFKSYVSVKDLNTLTPERFKQFMAALRDAGYNGDIKIFQDMSEQGIRLNDQIVMHGGSEADAKLGLEVAEKFFGADLDEKSLGKDEVIDGKNMSYSQILAKRIADAVRPHKSQ
ncbi:MAG: hypothetical protein WDN09_03695 [bacterium]